MSDQALPSSNELAGMRTVMAADRTLMAWVRTSLSLHSFGFTIYKVLQGFEKAGDLAHTSSPRTVGLTLVGIGTLAIIMGIIEYRHTLGQLGESRRFSLRHPTMIMALIMGVGGFILFTTMAAKLV